MQRYQWPGFAMQLVGELQKQQNNSQFCDTLLQTEGISIPTHSCILTALSPYLSQRLASSPSPPAGQKVRLQLPDVKAQTLLKLVGLLYSGELVVNRVDEQKDVLALARQFGIPWLSKEQRNVGTLTDKQQERRLERVRSSFHTTIQENSAYQQSSDFSDDTQSKMESQQRKNIGDREQPCQLARYVKPGERRVSSADTKQVRVGKNLQKMRDMQKTTETAEISVKNDFNHRTLHADVENVSPPAWTAQHSPVRDPDPSFSLTSFTSPPISPPQTTPDSQVPSSGCFTPHQECVLEAPSLLHGSCSVEESDEQIEKMLEDVMMGLNILPNLERDSKMSHRIQPNHHGQTATCQVPDSHKDVAHGQIHSAVSAAGCGFYQDLGTSSSTDTGVPCDCPAQCLPSCSALSSVLPDSILIQQQGCSTQYHASVRSQWRATLSKTQGYQHPEAPKTRPATPTAFLSTPQKKWQHKRRSPQVNNEIYPLTNGSEPCFCHARPLPCMDNIRLPRCCSPVEPYISPAKFSLYPNNATNFANALQPAPYLQSPPWVSGSLQMPLNTITHRQKTTKQSQIHMQMDRGSRTGSRSVEKAGSADRIKVPKRTKARMTDEEHGAEKKEVATRRKIIKLSCPQEPAVSLFLHKDVKVSDVTKSQLGLNICKVSLSSNNVLAKDRQRLKTEQACIQTSGNKEKSLNETNSEKRSESVAETPAVKQDVKKRKGGRPPKRKAPTVDKKRSHDEGGHQPRDCASKANLEKGDETKAVFKKRRRNRGKVVEEVSVMKTRHVGRKSKPETDVKDVNKPEILKRFQKLVRSQPSKTKSKTNLESVKAADRKQEAGNSSMNDSARVRAMDQEGSRHGDTSRCEEFPAVDNNNNYTVNTSQDEKKKSQQEESDGFQLPTLSSNTSILEEMGNTLKAVRRNSNKETTSGTGVSDSTQQPVFQDDKDLFPGHLPQKYKLPSSDNTSLHTPEETGPCLSGPRRISKSSGCEDEEDEEEVDVLRVSPVNVHTRKSEVSHMEVIPDGEEEKEEEEEEEDEIDVTGDEAD